MGTAPLTLAACQWMSKASQKLTAAVPRTQNWSLLQMLALMLQTMLAVLTLAVAVQWRCMKAAM